MTDINTMSDTAEPTESSDRLLPAGPVLRAGELTEALIEALKQDNAGKELTIADHGGYVRVEGPGGLILNRATAEEMLGRPFAMQELEIHMSGFSGKISMTSESVRWFFNGAPQRS
jgi:toluene monooxygenase system protein D